jgi:hypothetical protein
MPAEARGTSGAAAKAFVRHWIDVLNSAAATGDTSQLRSLSRQSCESCLSIAERIDQTYSAGGRIEGGGWSVLALKAVGKQPQGAPILEAGVRLSDQDYQPSEDAKVEHFEGGPQPMVFRLSWIEGQWMVRQLDKVE